MFLRGLSNLFCLFAHAFSARAILITHSAFDWLFRHALLSIKTSTSFLKGGNRGIANHKYAVRRAQLNQQKTNLIYSEAWRSPFRHLVYFVNRYRNHTLQIMPSGVIGSPKSSSRYQQGIFPLDIIDVRILAHGNLVKVQTNNRSNHHKG